MNKFSNLSHLWAPSYHARGLSFYDRGSHHHHPSSLDGIVGAALMKRCQVALSLTLPCDYSKINLWSTYLEYPNLQLTPNLLVPFVNALGSFMCITRHREPMAFMSHPKDKAISCYFWICARTHFCSRLLFRYFQRVVDEERQFWDDSRWLERKAQEEIKCQLLK